jgi:hypothetical protein
MGADLGAEPEDEAAPGGQLQVVRGLGQVHGAPGQGDGDAGAERDRARVLGGQGQRQERVVPRLRREEPVEPAGFHLLGAGGQVPEQTPGEERIDLHAELSS